MCLVDVGKGLDYSWNTGLIEGLEQPSEKVNLMA